MQNLSIPIFFFPTVFFILIVLSGCGETVKQSSDIDDPHMIIYQIEQKRSEGKTFTLDEMISYLTALNTLEPHPKTQAALEEYKRLKKEGARYLYISRKQHFYDLPEEVQNSFPKEMREALLRDLPD